MREIISQEKANEIVSAIEVALQPVVDAGHYRKTENEITLLEDGDVKLMRIGYSLNCCGEKWIVNRDIIAFPSRWPDSHGAHKGQRQRVIELLYAHMAYRNNKGNGADTIDALAFKEYVSHWKKEVESLEGPHGQLDPTLMRIISFGV